MNKLGKSIAILGFLLLCFSSRGLAQHPSIQISELNAGPKKAPFLHSVEGEAQLGFGGGVLGLMGKANHLWDFRLRSSFMASVSLSSFVKSEAYSNPPTEISGTSFDTHLRLHAQWNFAFLRGRMEAILGIYAGGFLYRTRGNYVQTDLNIDQDFKTSNLNPDWGTRVSLTYMINPNWGIQMSFTNSWRQAGFGLGIPAGLLAGEPDGKSILGLGVIYKLPRKRVEVKREYLNDL